MEAASGHPTQAVSPPSVGPHQDRGALLTAHHHTNLNTVGPSGQVHRPNLFIIGNKNKRVLDILVVLEFGWYYRLENLLHFPGRTILLIRNPYKTFIRQTLDLTFSHVSFSGSG